MSEQAATRLHGSRALTDTVNIFHPAQAVALGTLCLAALLALMPACVVESPAEVEPEVPLEETDLQADGYASSTSAGGNALGIWLTDLRKTGWGTHASLASDLAAAGVKRVYLPATAIAPAPGGGVTDGASARSVLGHYRDRGVVPWVWADAAPGSEVALADRLRAATSADAGGFVLGVGGDMLHRAEALRALLETLRRARSEVTPAGADPAETLPLYTSQWGPALKDRELVEVAEAIADAHLPVGLLELPAAAASDAVAQQLVALRTAYQELGVQRPVHPVVDALHPGLNSAHVDSAFRTLGPETSVWQVPETTAPNLWATLSQAAWHTDFGGGPSGSLTLRCPATTPVGMQTPMAGTCRGDIQRLVVRLDDSVVLYDGPVDASGGFALQHRFERPGAGRRVSATGYTARGDEVASVQASVDVLGSEAPQPRLDLLLPQAARVGEAATLAGTASGAAHTVVVSVDGWRIGTAPVRGGEFALEYAFTMPGQQRQVLAVGYDEAGEVLAQASGSLDVLPELQPFLTLDAPGEATVGTSVTLRGAAGGGVVRVRLVLGARILTAVDVQGEGYALEHTFEEPGEGLTLRAHGLNAEGAELLEATATLSVRSGEQPSLTLVAPDRSTVGESTPLSGAAGGGVVRVRVLADEWEIASLQVAGGRWETSYAFNAAGNDRVLQALGLDGEGNELLRVQRRIDIAAATTYIEGVPYFYQYANSIHPGGSCQNTSMAMVLRFYGAADETPDAISTHHGTQRAQTVAGWESVFNTEARHFGLDVRDAGTTQGTLARLQELLGQGRPVVVHGYFTASGHVIVLLGYDGERYWAHDPAGRWNEALFGGYLSGGATAGRYVTYSTAALERAITYPDGWVWMHEPYTP